MRSDAFRAAVQAKELSASGELFTDNPIFRSPVVFKAYEGAEAINALLGAVFQVFEDFHYTAQVEDGDTAMLLFEAKVEDRELNGVDILRFDGEGKISELMVMIRPLSALNAVAEAMGQKLAAMGVPAPGR